MTLWLLLTGVLAPALFWAGYLYYKDRYRPEPLKLLGIVYLSGIAAARICLEFIEFLPRIGLPSDPFPFIENDRLRSLASCLVINGFVEEVFKLIPFLFIIPHLRAFDEKTDGIIYASMIALGFASFENIGYLAGMEGFELIGRAMASPLTHAVFSSIWGYSIARALLTGRSGLLAGGIGLATAAVAHGLFNFLNLSPALRIFSSLLILAIWVWQLRILEKAALESRERAFVRNG